MPTSALDFLGDVTPNTRKKAAEVLAYVEAQGHRLWHIWGKGSSSEHATGRALDLMVYRRTAEDAPALSIDSEAGDKIAAYLWAHRVRLGLQHIIWRQRIISTVVSPGVWRDMADRGSPTQNHMDHPHVYFSSDTYHDPQPIQQVSRPVLRLQGLLEVGVDGVWGPNTDAAALAFRAVAVGKGTALQVRLVQGMVDVVRDGIVGPITKDRVRNHIVAIQRDVLTPGLGYAVVADGVWGPKTDEAFLAFRQKHRTT